MIIVVNNIPFLADALRAQHEVMSVPYTLIDNALLRHTECEALFVRTTTKINDALLDKTNVRFVGTATSGVDHVDLQSLANRSIALANAAGSNANAVAEWVLYAMLKRAEERAQDLASLTLGVVGFGNIGKLISAYAQHIGMSVVVNDRPLQESGYSLPDSLGSYCELSDLLQVSDVITNHVPFTQNGAYATHRMFSQAQLEMCKKDAHFIHSSRGGIVDEQALANFLDGSQRDVSMDVWEAEPEYSLDLARRVRLASPHISGHSEDGIIDAADTLLRAYSQFRSQSYDTSIVSRHRSTQLQNIEQQSDLASLCTALGQRLQLEAQHAALQHPYSESPAGRREYFLEQRFSYSGRREYLRRPSLL